MNRLTPSLRSAIFATAALLVAACTTTRDLADAQREFDAGATAEINAAAAPGGDPLLDRSAEAAYARALALVEKDIAKNAEELRREKLLGNDYTLQALTQWRLGDLRDDPALFAAADRTAEIALKDETGLGTRDRVILRAINGLTDHERGVRAGTYDDAVAHFADAYKYLGKALADVSPPPDHPIRIWVGLAQMQTSQAWYAALDRETKQTLFDRDTPTIVENWKRAAMTLKPFFRANPALKEDVRRRAAVMGIDEEPALFGTSSRPREPADGRTAASARAAGSWMPSPLR